MARPALEVADIFRGHGAAWRDANAAHVSLGQLQVMSAIERCRTAALGGHVAACEACNHTQIAYNSCRNRHCPKCQGAAARNWLAERQADLLPVPYFHVVFTLPAAIADLAYQNKAVIYDALFKASSEALLTIAADPKHLGARIGVTAVLHTWGSAMTHHPHVHMIVPGGGISLDGSSWARCRPGFFLPVRVLSKLFRRLLLEQLAAAHAAGKLQFFGEHARLAAAGAFAAFLAPLKTTRWFVYSKRPFAGPQAVLAYLARYTHRVAISNHRLAALDANGVTFRYKDYRRNGQERYRTMTLVPGEFIRRFLLHVLPKGFHRIRHSGLLASAARKANIARARQLLAGPAPQTVRAETTRAAAAPNDHRPPCPCCGGRMIIVATFERVVEWRGRVPPSMVENEMRDAAAVVLLSSYAEGVPRALIEAAALGAPIITTDAPGCRDVVVHRQSGFLCRKGCLAGDASEAMRRLLEEPDLASQMGRRGREIAMQFDKRRVLSETLNVYERITVA